MHLNLKNREGLEKFKEATSKEVLTSIVSRDNDANTLTKKFMKQINGLIHECFKKIRITENNDSDDIIKLFDKRRKLRTKTDEISIKELKIVEENLAEKCAETNYKHIKEELKDIECDEGGFNVGKLWKLKKKLCPYKKDPPTAMLDSCGNLVTSAEGIKKITLEHFKNVLGNRPIKKGLEDLKKEKENLCETRIELARLNKSKPWTMENLDAVLLHLKKGKSRDPNDNSNELFHSDTAGPDLKNAILVLMNKIKDQGIYPQQLEACNISPIYKKGKRNLFDNYRGVFRLTILRSILDRLIYNDVYPVIDSNLTDANVGARKGRNIRDNLFVLNAV